MRLLFLSALLSSALGAVVLAAKEQKGPTEPATRPANSLTAESEPSPVNTHCAVERENAIDARVSIWHDGRAIGFCCKDCVKDFRKDPRKYLADLK